MAKVLIVILIIGILATGGKYILFHPKANAVIHVFVSCLVCVRVLPDVNIILTIVDIALLLVVIYDCVRDWKIADKCYDNIELRLDEALGVKSISSVAIFLLQLMAGGAISESFGRFLLLASVLASRSIYTVLVCPKIEAKVTSDVRQKFISGHPLPVDIKDYSKSVPYRYYYDKAINDLLGRGRLVSNGETIRAENAKSTTKLEESYPKKALEKIAEKVAGGKDIKEERNNAEKRIRSAMNHQAYISNDFYEKYSAKITDFLASRGPLSPCDFGAYKGELASINYNVPCGIRGDEDWSEYFAIQSLQPYVDNGTIEDLACSDQILINHAYHHTASTKGIASIDASDDPRLALDDD